ncbi:uncharacterized protein LOC122356546 [Puntigrus tetrazona]|uniref:uncharacterized protein LOC122356546 n=1 Tax=Puntigrus tetrazona TaxID=1606681 RepID=UPI001C89BB13|nr:uncharacterized protein LOC122356546 [Puntigrus tetrazona]XP_043111303.1 uncharacterized protein LOC122356546 [Puntigrus tetrazona]XP_043111304.1 uncharacterized protein LOC122356546 [Puntigrus tetrazona]
MNGVSADAQVGKEERDVWHKRLRLRKTSFSLPAERSAVKEERDVTARGWKATGKSEKALNTFTCSSCDDGISFGPGELMMHFKIAHGGKGSPPAFPCDVCAFSSPAFAALQQHRMQHDGCLFACGVCGDGVRRTLPQLTEHCQTRHALAGRYECPKCELSFREVTQFACHPCGAANGGAPKNELFKRMAAACRRRWSRRNWRKRDGKLSQEFERLLPKPEPRWTSRLLPFSTNGVMDDYGVLLDPEKTLEETQQYLERTACAGKNWSSSFNGERGLVSPLPSPANAKWCAGNDKLSGLMEKNNISVPPDCTTKVVRFKMVDGKKHLVLKVIPSNKQDAPKDRQERSDDIRTRVAPRSSPSVGKAREGCAAQQDFLSSVVERIRSQQSGGDREPAGVRLEARDRNSLGDCQDKAFSESEENFTACQGDSGCHSDLTSDAGSSEERCSSRLVSAPFDELDPPEGFGGVSPSSGSPRKDPSECQSEDGGLLFRGDADECTNNMDPRERPVPVGQTESCSAPVDELPLTTVIHLLDEARADRTLPPHAGSDGALRDFTRAADANQRSSTSVTATASGSSVTSVPSVPLASLDRKRAGDRTSAGSKSPKPPPPASVLFWEPAPRDAPATLRLIPHSSSQSVKIPRGSQPVIVLNHPDSDIPEVANIMRVVHRHRGAVRRVLLSRKTLKALSESACDAFRRGLVAGCHASHRRRAWPNGTVKERFSLKLRLKRVCGRKYTVVPTASESVVLQPAFKCWFCGRLFANQEAWVGHGQRHLMEATRGWNQLFGR